MQHLPVRLASVISIALLGLPALAHANEANRASVPPFPSGDGCWRLCHDGGPGGARNPFGLDFEFGNDSVSGNAGDHVWNAWLAGRDSDGDGWTNGQELGDAFAQWSSGTTRAGFQSWPGNPASEPNVDPCSDDGLSDCASVATCDRSSAATGRWSCDCPAGYTGDGHRRSRNHAWVPNVCSASERASHDCDPAYELYASVQLGCQNVNECSDPNRCGVGSCTDQAGTYRCTCPSGWDPSAPTGGTCVVDPTECPAGACAPGSCTPAAGHYQCTCPSGYRFDGEDCVLDGAHACSAGADDCAPQADRQPVGTTSWTCTCRAGYVGTGTPTRGTGDRCANINECAGSPRPCGNGTCVDTEGSYRCVCARGYHLEDGRCVDDDECQDRSTCAPGVCSNRPGSYTCSCPDGYRAENGGCVDVDECEGVRCGRGECVQREPGNGFTCRCATGYRFDGTRCVDVDECATGATCAIGATCANTEGGFTCTCPAGYQGDGFSCVDANECEGEAQCDANADCVNLSGSYVCVCNPGWEGSGLSCRDVNECVRGVDGCAVDQECSNTVGSHACDCEVGFVASAGRCEPQCGDGRRVAGEQCDDGNTVDRDGCSADCVPEAGHRCTQVTLDGPTTCVVACGDGLIDVGEECDDGGDNGLEADRCRPDCRAARCGDGIVDSGEECDGDADGSCTDWCRFDRCGDGVVDFGEVCDRPDAPDCGASCEARGDGGPSDVSTGRSGCAAGGSGRSPAWWIVIALIGGAWWRRSSRVRRGGSSQRAAASAVSFSRVTRSASRAATVRATHSSHSSTSVKPAQPGLRRPVGVSVSSASSSSRISASTASSSVQKPFGSRSLAVELHSDSITPPRAP